MSKPKLSNNMTVESFSSYYWTLEELKSFARQNKLSVEGGKLNISDRIRRYLLSNDSDVANTKPNAIPDSCVVIITDSTPVVFLKLDAMTRQYFVSKLGKTFRFNQYLRDIASLENQRSLNLTYGNLVTGWKSYEERKKKEGTVIGSQFQYNQFTRDYFADKNRAVKSKEDCIAAWKLVRDSKGEPTYNHYCKLKVN